MSDGENPVLSYFATSHDSASWLGGADDGAADDPFAQVLDTRLSSDGGPPSDSAFASAQSQYVDEFEGGAAQSIAFSGNGDSGFEVAFGGGGAGGDVDLSNAETNPFLISPLEPVNANAPISAVSGIDAYFGNAADNWLGENTSENNWLSEPEPQAHHAAAAARVAPPLIPLRHSVQPVSPVAKPTLYSVPAQKAATSHAAPPPLLPAKPEGFVSPSKFFPPSAAPGPSYNASARLPVSDDPVLKKNYPEGRRSGAAWAMGGKLFVFSAEYGMQNTHSVSLHSCGTRSAFQASVARMKAWPGCDASPDAMAKFLGDLKSFKIEDQTVELASPYQDSFEALTSLLSLLLTRSNTAFQQHLSDVLAVFDDSNSFSDSMNLVSNIDAFRPSDATRDLGDIQQYLLEGKCDMAIEHAMRSDLWAEAMVLSQMSSDSSLLRTVNQRLTERCLVPGTPLWFVHALNSGVVPSGPELHSHWRLCAKILLQNQFCNASEGLRALARAVLSQGDACAWIVLNAAAAVVSKEKQPHIAAANISTPPAADIADLLKHMNGMASIRAIKSKDNALWSDEQKRLVARERDVAARLEDFKARAPSKQPQQGSLFYGFPSEPSPALMHPTTCERAEMLSAAFAGKAKGHMVRGLLYWRFMHAMWMADHGMHSEAVALFHSVQKRGNEVEYETGKWLSSCAEKAVQRLERNRASTAPTASSGGSLFGGIGSFVDSTVKFLVTGADAPAAPIKADPAPERTAAQQPAPAVAPTGRKIAFFNPHAGRQQIAQQLHQQPAPQAQQSQVAEPADVEREQARTAAENAPPPASPTPKLDRSSSDPVKSDASKSASGSPGEKQKGKGGWGIGSFIGGIVSKVLPASKGVEVDLGGESTMYFNEKLGRYVERGKEDEAAAEAVVAPPPMMAAWSEQPAVAPRVSSQTATSQDSAYTPPGGGGFSAAQAAATSAPSQPVTASGPPMPSGTVRAAAPPSSSASALGKSRYAVAGVAVTPASASSLAASTASPVSAARPRPQYKVFVPQAAASEQAAGGDADLNPGQPS